MIEWAMPTPKTLIRDEVPHAIPSTDCPNCKGQTQGAHLVGLSGGYEGVPLTAQIQCPNGHGEGLIGWVYFADVTNPNPQQQEKAE